MYSALSAPPISAQRYLQNLLTISRRAVSRASFSSALATNLIALDVSGITDESFDMSLASLFPSALRSQRYYVTKTIMAPSYACCDTCTNQFRNFLLFSADAVHDDPFAFAKVFALNHSHHFDPYYLASRPRLGCLPLETTSDNIISSRAASDEMLWSASAA